MATKVKQPKIGSSGTIRNLAIDPKLENLLNAVGNEVGVSFIVNSGGQPKKGEGTRRTGSTRHDDGNAADVQAVDSNGNLIDFTTPEGKEIWSRIVQLARAGGATGIGAGVNYMGSTTVHIGYGNEAVWSSAKSGQPVEPWLTKAFAAGKTTPPLNIPQVASKLDIGSAMTGSVQIRAGDTLTSLAKKYGTSVAALQKANGIKDANKIQAGQNIVVPGLADQFPRQVMTAEQAFADSTKGLNTSSIGAVQRKDMGLLDSIVGALFPGVGTSAEPTQGNSSVSKPTSIGEQIMSRILPSSVTQGGAAAAGKTAPIPMTPPPGLRTGAATAQGQSAKAGGGTSATPKQTEYAILASGKKIAVGRHTASDGKEVIVTADENGKAVIKPVEIPFYIKELGNDTIVGGIARREAAEAAKKAAAAATQKVADIGSGLGGMLGGLGGLFGAGPQTAVATELSVNPTPATQKSAGTVSSGGGSKSGKSSGSSQSSSSSGGSGKVLKGSSTGTQYKEGQIVTTSSGKQKKVVDNGSGVAKFVEI